MNPAEKIACCSCEGGHYEEIFDRYETVAADDVKVVIPRVKLLRCQNCGDELLPPETQKQIDEAIADQTEQLTARELEGIWEGFNLDQTAMADVLGLGGKTFHRWLKGTQYPSRSMGYYLRVVGEFPEVFEWLKSKGWRRRNRVAQFEKIEFQLQFPELARISTETEWSRTEALSAPMDGRLRFNPTAFFRKTKV